MENGGEREVFKNGAEMHELARRGVVEWPVGLEFSGTIGEGDRKLATILLQEPKVSKPMDIIPPSNQF